MTETRTRIPPSVAEHALAEYERLRTKCDQITEMLGTAREVNADLLAASERLQARVAELEEIAALVIQHFEGTDAPLGKQARAALANCEGGECSHAHDAGGGEHFMECERHAALAKGGK